MQNRYTGDAGDFGKYGLLRTICGHREDSDKPLLSLGMLWYLTPDESHNADGKHVFYLDYTRRRMSQYAACDFTLYQELGYIVHSNNRAVAAVQESRIFNQNQTAYFPELLDYTQVDAAPKRIAQARAEYRALWLDRAIKSLQASDVVFLDPDMGIDPSIPKGHRNAHRYAYLDEAQQLVDQSPKTIVVYHHTGRSANAETQTLRKLRPLADAFETEPFAMLYHRGSSRAFLIVPAPHHQETIASRIHRMLGGPWQRHFTIITL